MCSSREALMVMFTDAVLCSSLKPLQFDLVRGESWVELVKI